MLALADVEHRSHRVEADTEFVQKRGIQFGANRRLGAAAHEYLSHALNLRQLLRKDGVGGVVHLRQRNNVRGESQNQNRRVRRIYLPIIGVVGQVSRKLAAGCIDGRLHVTPRGIDVAVKVELHRTIPVVPNWLTEVIWLMPAIRPNCRSSGVATDEAIVSGLAPGNEAPTEMTGNSTCGKGATGRKLNASVPAMSRAAASNDVPMGRFIKGAEIFMAKIPRRLARFIDRVAGH